MSRQPRRRLAPCTRACVHWLTFYFADRLGKTVKLSTVIRDAQQVGFNSGTTTPAINDLARSGIVLITSLGDEPFVVAPEGRDGRIAAANDDVF